MATPMSRSEVRQALLDALRAAAPDAFDADTRRRFLVEPMNVRLADLELDSLEQMEFCIAVELSTGVTLVPSQLADLESTDAVEQRILELLG